MAATAKKIIGFIGTSAFLFAFTFEGLLGLGANLDANRALMEERVRVSQTSFDGVHEAAVEANMSALDSYNETLKIEQKLYDLN